jgi:HSP20 family protein
MDRLLQDFLEESPTIGPAWLGRRSFPAVNMWQDEDTVYLEAEIPGVRREDVNINVVERECTIRGERKPTAEGETYLFQERECGPFTRVIRLPVDVKNDRAEATVADGVLTIRLPKAEAARMRTIKVKALPE